MPPTFDLEPKPLSEKNRIGLGAEHARLELTRNAVRQEQANTNGGYRKQIKELNKRAKEISEQLDQDVYRERIDVEEKPVDQTFMVKIFRAGTKEEIGSREMTAEEKKEARKRIQPELPMNGKGRGNSKMSKKENGPAAKPAEEAVVPDDYVPEGIEHRGQKLSHSKKNKPKPKGKRS